HLTSSPRCYFNSNADINEGDPRFINEGERYRVAFTALETDFGGGDCSYPVGHYFDKPEFDSPHLFSAPFLGVFPEIAFWSRADGGGMGKSFYMHTRVKPERDY
ncbi:MAG: hypothetical protein ABEK04_04890, partial [Candidatus Nanohalobium sp.]